MKTQFVARPDGSTFIPELKSPLIINILFMLNRKPYVSLKFLGGNREQKTSSFTKIVQLLYDSFSKNF